MEIHPCYTVERRHDLKKCSQCWQLRHFTTTSSSFSSYTPRMPRLICAEHKGKRNATFVSTGYEMTEAVHRWSDNEGHQFRCRGSNVADSVWKDYVRRQYRCIRSECRRKEGKERRAFFDDKLIDCPASLTVYQWNGELTVYIHQKSAHNHDPGHKYNTLVPEASEKLVSMFEDNPSLKPTEYLTLIACAWQKANDQ